MGCQLADELASGFGLHAHASEHCIDVLADGFAFRIFLASERYVASVAPEEGCDAVFCLKEHISCKRVGDHPSIWQGLRGTCP